MFLLDHLPVCQKASNGPIWITTNIYISHPSKHQLSTPPTQLLDLGIAVEAIVKADGVLTAALGRPKLLEEAADDPAKLRMGK